MLKTVPVLDLQTLWSFAEGTKVLVINHEHNHVLVRSDIEHEDKSIERILVFDPDQGYILTEDSLAFKNGRLKPWWSLETEDNWHAYLEVYVLVKNEEILVKKILEEFHQTQNITDSNLCLVIDYLQNLLNQVQSMGNLKFYLFESEIVRELETFRHIKAIRELHY